MAIHKKPDAARQAQLQAELKRDREARQNSYRARALKMFPPICGSCRREFSGKRLSELTVHHKDHNHDNNPPDGSNWELLCIYCHDHEHEKHLMKGYGGGGVSSTVVHKEDASFNPFGALDSLLKKDDGEEKAEG